MKLLVITMLYEPDCVGIAAIATDMCHALAERGHDITVYTTYPYYPEWTLKSDVNPWRIQQEALSNVRGAAPWVVHSPPSSAAAPATAARNVVSDQSAAQLFDRERYDAVMVFCPLLGSVAFAAFRKLFHRELLWVNVQDIPAEAGLATGINRSRTLSLSGFARPEAAVPPRRDLEQYFAGHGRSTRNASRPPRQPFISAPTGSSAHSQNRCEHLPSKAGRPIQVPTRFLYCGTIGKKQGLLRFCQQLSACDLDFHFRIRGAGSEASAVRDWIAQQGDCEV